MLLELSLIIVGIIIGVIITYALLSKALEVKWTTKFDQWKIYAEEEIRKLSTEQQRASLKGKITEQIAPLLKEFKYKMADARFIGSPIDYIIFDGLSEKRPVKIVFLDVKTGEKAQLTPVQKLIKMVVEKKEVIWETLKLNK